MENPAGLDMIKSLVYERAGLCFDNIRADILLKCVKQGMLKKNLGTPREFYGVIKSSEAEFAGFVNGLTVNETFFFREPAYLRLFADKIFDEIHARKKGGEKIRILSAGCSTGEEPYSIAMSLMNRFGPGISSFCEITGVDIDANAVKAAQKGAYWELSFRGGERSDKDRYFEKSEQGLYRIKPQVREAVSFRRLNLLDIGSRGDIPPQDAVFYRNVSIYFSPEMQERIFRGLASALCEGGWLVTASSEVMSHDNGPLELVKSDGLYLFRKKPLAAASKRGKMPSVAGKDKKPPFRVAEMELVVNARRKRNIRPIAPHSICAKPQNAGDSPDFNRPDALFEAALGLYRKKNYKEALMSLDAAGLGDAKSMVLKGCIYMNLGMLDEAVKSCEAALKLDGLSREAYLVLGSAYRHKGASAESQRMFQKALYIQPKCWIAHYYIAELCFEVRDSKRAVKHFRKALDIFEASQSGRSGKDEMGLFDISFQKEDIAHLFRKRLSSLGEA